MSEIKTIKRLKKEKSMYNSMETYLKAKGLKMDRFQINKEPKDEKEKESFHPEFILQGTFENIKPFNFQITVHPELLNENNNPQVELHMEVEKGKFTTLQPQSNGQLHYIITHFIPTVNKRKLLEFIKEETKETKEK
jgi:hypothetical protein